MTPHAATDWGVEDDALIIHYFERCHAGKLPNKTEEGEAQFNTKERVARGAARTYNQVKDHHNNALHPKISERAKYRQAALDYLEEHPLPPLLSTLTLDDSSYMVKNGYLVPTAQPLPPPSTSQLLQMDSFTPLATRKLRMSIKHPPRNRQKERLAGAGKKPETQKEKCYGARKAATNPPPPLSTLAQTRLAASRLTKAKNQPARKWKRQPSQYRNIVGSTIIVSRWQQKRTSSLAPASTRQHTIEVVNDKTIDDSDFNDLTSMDSADLEALLQGTTDESDSSLSSMDSAHLDELFREI